jgi:hypothetical protein
MYNMFVNLRILESVLVLLENMSAHISTVMQPDIDG